MSASELIPSIYLDFVRGGHADPLVPVFQHNQMDLRGLAGLSSRILSLLSDEEGNQSGRVRAVWCFPYLRATWRGKASSNCTNSQLCPRYRKKRIAPPARPSRDWQSVTETSHARTNFGKVRWATLARVTRLMSSWQFITNMRPAIRDEPWRLHVRRSTSFAVQTNWERLRRPRTTRPRKDLNIACCVSKRKASRSRPPLSAHSRAIASKSKASNSPEDPARRRDIITVWSNGRGVINDVFPISWKTCEWSDEQSTCYTRAFVRRASPRLVALGPERQFSSLLRKQPGFPFGSLMPYGLDDEGRPIFLISTMAAHAESASRSTRQPVCD